MPTEMQKVELLLNTHLIGHQHPEYPTMVRYKEYCPGYTKKTWVKERKFRAKGELTSTSPQYVEIKNGQGDVMHTQGEKPVDMTDIKIYQEKADINPLIFLLNTLETAAPESKLILVSKKDIEDKGYEIEHADHFILNPFIEARAFVKNKESYTRLPRDIPKKELIVTDYECSHPIKPEEGRTAMRSLVIELKSTLKATKIRDIGQQLVDLAEQNRNGREAITDRAESHRAMKKLIERLIEYSDEYLRKQILGDMA